MPKKICQQIERRITFCITLASQTDSNNSIQKGKTMARKAQKLKNFTGLPGTIYLNKNRCHH